MARKVQGGTGRVVEVIGDADLKKNGGKYVVIGRNAIAVHGLSFGERKIVGGRPIRVYPVTQEQLDRGDFRLVGGSAETMLDVNNLPRHRISVSGKQAIPVFVTSGAPLGLIDIFFAFDPLLTTFTPAMAKRTAPGPFETAPIVQGKWDGTGEADLLSARKGNSIVDKFYQNIDMNQGSISFWITPEWDGDDGLRHYIFTIQANTWAIFKNAASELGFTMGSASTVTVDASGWTAGTTYHVICRWDINNTLDGTNHACISVNNSHTFGVATAPAVITPQDYSLGKYTGSTYRSADAIIEGFCVSRMVWFDGTYGNNLNGEDVDVIEEVYAAGAGKDPALVLGSWDTTLFFPTDSAAGELASGAGELWSHPHASAILEQTFMADGGYMGEPWAVEFDDANTVVNCGSDASLDDLHDAAMTVEAWIKADGWGENEANGGYIISKVIAGGWLLTVSNIGGLRGTVLCDTTNAFSESGLDEFTIDGKWHHVAMFFDDAGDRKIYLAIDGKWVSSYGTQIAGVDAITTDAADDLIIGNNSTSVRTFDGQIGWVRISDNDRYSHETDFIPPVLMPAADGDTVEQWALDEGTGTTIAAVVDGNNDGTLSNGTWKEQWDYQGSVPIKPTSIEFDGSATVINCGSGASLDDLHSGEFTVEVWVRHIGGINEVITSKMGTSLIGWDIGILTNNPSFRVWTDTIDGKNTHTVSISDGQWHHFVGHYNSGGSRVPNIAIDGVWDVAGVAATGTISSDAAEDLLIGDWGGAGGYLTGAIAWVRISDNDRYDGATPTNFTPPSRSIVPADDGNTVSLWQMDEGAGTTVADSNGNSNDGTLTPGTGGWLTTHDLSHDASGEQIFGVGGYVFAVDAANEGIEQSHVGLDAGENYVLRLLAHVDASSPTDDIRVRIWDDTNNAQIGADFDFGAGSSRDEPGVAIFTWELPTVSRHGVGSDCVAMTVMILGTAAGQTINVHQCEVQENLVDNPSLETGAGNPWIPDGWTNSGLDAGETVQELATIHSGLASMKWTGGLTAAEQIYKNLANVARFLGAGVFSRSVSTRTLEYGSGAAMSVQYASGVPRLAITADAGVWVHNNSVFRQYGAANVSLGTNYLGAGDIFIDDVYFFALDPVSLTVTPANEANSTENGGLRVDGLDMLTQPIIDIEATRGKIRFNWTPRHSSGKFTRFGFTQPRILRLYKNVSNYIEIYWLTEVGARITFRVATIVTNAGWNPAGRFVAGTKYLIEIEYNATQFTLSIDGLIVATGTPGAGIDFGVNIPDVAYWGAQNLGSSQIDSVFSAP